MSAMSTDGLTGVISEYEIIPEIDGFTLVVRRKFSLLVILPVAFLLFWLCGWAAGEGFAIWALAGLIRQALAASSHPNTQPLVEATTRTAENAKNGGSLFAAGFLLFWLAFWTFGGIMAMRQVKRLIARKDVYRFTGEQIKGSCGIGKMGTTLRAVGDAEVRLEGDENGWSVRCELVRGVMTIGPLEDREIASRLRDDLCLRYPRWKKL